MHKFRQFMTEKADKNNILNIMRDVDAKRLAHRVVFNKIIDLKGISSAVAERLRDDASDVDRGRLSFYIAIRKLLDALNIKNKKKIDNIMADAKFAETSTLPPSVVYKQILELI